MKKFISLVLAGIMISSVLLAGCSNADTTATTATTQENAASAADTTVAEETKAADLPFVELNYYIVGTPQPDMERVNEELNKILLEKINAKVTVHLLDWGAYDQKMSVMIASGEEFDACFTAPWINNYNFNIAKGALLPLDDLMDKYMPVTKASMSPEIWDAARVNGSIYGVINQQIMARQSVLSITKAAADKYGFDPASVTKLEDMEPYLAAVKAGEADATEMIQTYGIGVIFPYWNMEDMGGDQPGLIRTGDTTVINQYESEEFKAHALLMKDWYEKGYFSPDALTATTDQSKVYMRIPGTYKPGLETEEATYFLEDTYIMRIGETQLTTGNAIATMTGISSTSKNPERTAMFLELMNTDKDIYNLMVFGIEGVHYTKTGDNRIELIENSGYSNAAWELGNQFNAYLLPGQADDVWEQTKQLNDSTVPSVLMGFSFDVEPVKSELANCAAVVTEYLAPLMSGAVPDVEAAIKEFNDKLKEAGVETVIAEKQKQVDAFLASK